MPHISTVIMAFNESDGLKKVFGEIQLTLSEMGNSYEILIIDDGSTDGTKAIAEGLAEEFASVRVIHHKTNQGLGGVYRTGFLNAQGDYITFFPADGQFPATIIKEFFSFMDNYDMVLGHLPRRKSSFLAKGLSKAEKIFYTLLFGPLPEFQGILMFRRSLLKEIELKSAGRGWTVLMELIIRTQRGGYRLISVPTQMRPRISGTSKVNNISTIWDNLKQAFILRRYI